MADAPSKAIASALLAAQVAVKRVAKDSKNAHHGYAYASSDDLAAECKRALNASGLALCRIGCTVQPATEMAPANVVALYMLVHSSGDSWMLEPVTVPAIPDKGRPLDKAVAGALTYSAGYTSLGLLQIERVDEHHPDARDDRGDVEPLPIGAKAKALLAQMEEAADSKAKLAADNACRAAWSTLNASEKALINDAESHWRRSRGEA